MFLRVFHALGLRVFMSFIWLGFTNYFDLEFRASGVLGVLNGF